MFATEILANEHRVIEVVLDCLEKMSDQADATGQLDWHAARDTVDFLQTFADGCHHRKEESGLFQIMEQRGFTPYGGPTGVMLAEHEAGRDYVAAMAEAVADARRRQSDALPRFVAAARAYIPLLRQHILKEENRLFPMANAVLTPADQEELLHKFDQVEDDDVDPGEHERYLKLANNLAERFGVQPAWAPETESHSCCGHAR